MVTPYSLELEVQMRALYKRLSEKDRRLYAGIEALKLPTGGISYIARLLNCSRDTVMRGIELQDFYQYLLQKYSQDAAPLQKNKASAIAPRLVKPFTPLSRDAVYER